MVKGVNYTDSGEGLIMPRGISGVIDSKGQGAMITTSGGKASFTFHEIGHSDSNGTITATGAAFFDANATGKLAFLGTVVAVYKDQIYKDGTDKVIAWKWKYSLAYIHDMVSLSLSSDFKTSRLFYIARRYEKTLSTSFTMLKALLPMSRSAGQ
jgi:hypothetical protein